MDSAVSLLCFSWILLIFNRLCSGYIVKVDQDFEGHKHANPRGSPWPIPQRWRKTDFLLTIDPEKFTFNSNVDCDIIQDAFARYRHIILERTVSFQSRLHRELESVEVDIIDGKCEDFPWEYMDERYDLRVTMEAKVFLQAKAIWGVLRGLETFSQLVWKNEEHEFLVNKTRIEDVPKYRHRGVMIDTTSHYIPVRILKLNLDAMSYNKMNVFHWKLVGDESFPYASSGYPELYQKGAYSRYHVYDHKTITDVIEHARLRGIRVIPHIDVLANHRSINFSHPELFLPCRDESGRQLSSDSIHHPSRLMINPTDSATYSLIIGLLYEVAQLFPDPMIHIGFDNPTNICWINSPDIKAAVKADKLGSIFSHYYKKITDAMWSRTIQTIVWQNAVQRRTPVNGNRTLVQVLSATPSLARQLRRNNASIILGWDDFVNSRYSWTSLLTEGLNPFKGHQTKPSICFGPGLMKQIRNSKWPSIMFADLPQKSIAGGEALVWTDKVDGTNLISSLWPKASALAEILWRHTDEPLDEVMFRLDEQRCRLVRRGLAARPLFPGHCGDSEYDGRPVNTATNHRQLAASVLYVTFICLLDAMSGGGGGGYGDVVQAATEPEPT